MTRPLTRSAFLKDFTCLGERCEDTCCKGWGMQLDEAMLQRYKTQAPELLDAVDTGEADHIMRRDPVTDYCVKFNDGLCSIHAKYGTDFLGEACHFYPRVSRGAGDAAYMTAALSCPETARLMLFGKDAFAYDYTTIDRLPRLTNYLPEGMQAEKAMALHQFFLSTADPSTAPERVLARLATIAQSLQSLTPVSWPEAIHVYFKTADSLLPEPEFALADPFNLLHALAGLVAASKKSKRARLEQVIEDMEKALCVTLDWQTVGIATTADSLPAYQRIARVWHEERAAVYAPALCHWIQAELALAFFPFAGFGGNLVERISVIGVRFATVKLAMMCAASVQNSFDENDVVRIVQSLSRFLDHLADPTLSLAIYTETGWLRPARLRALIGDF